jgi:hypothetical protein
MTAEPGADERRIRHLLHTRGVSYTPQPQPTLTPTHPAKANPTVSALIFFALTTTVALTACLMLRRPIAKDTTVLAGTMLGACSHAVVSSPWIEGLLHV